MRVRRVHTRKKLIPITQQGSNPKKKSTPSGWWWDPPKLIPIIISVAALSVSLLSWRESYRGRLINEEINRPVMSLVGYSHAEDDMRNAIFTAFEVKLKNTGKSTARIANTQVTVDYVESSVARCIVMNGTEKEAFLRYDIKEAIPGIEVIIVKPIYVTLDCKKASLMKFRIRTTIHYIDLTSGRQYFQNFYDVYETSREDKK